MSLNLPCQARRLGDYIPAHLVGAAPVAPVEQASTPYETFGRADDPEDQSVLTEPHVDLSPFCRPRAKIDVIKIIVSAADLGRESLAQIKEAVCGGRLKVTPRRDFSMSAEQPWIATHDPQPCDLRFLVDRFWSRKIAYIEFAVDFRLPDGANDLGMLAMLKSQLRHCLFPQRHGRFRLARRKFYQLDKNCYRRDGLGTAPPQGQLIYETPGITDQVALYIKERDDNQLVSQPWVRIEARLEAGGPREAGIERVGMLPAFGSNLRRYLAPAFWIADGIRETHKLTPYRVNPQKTWVRWGAQFAAGKPFTLTPNVHANRLIGEALKDLGRMLEKLPPPSALSGRYGDWLDDQRGW